MSEINRRDFLRLASKALITVSALLGLDAMVRFLSYERESSVPKTFDVGRAADFPLGSRTVLPEIPALLVHDENGFFALSLICPHLGCTVDKVPDGFSCPCHGSRYDENGALEHGPSTQSLSSLSVDERPNGHLIIKIS